MRSLFLVLIGFAFLSLVDVAAPVAHAGRGRGGNAEAAKRPNATKGQKVRRMKVRADAAGKDYFVRNRHFGGAWSRVQIEPAPKGKGKATGKEKITHIYMPSSVTTMGIHKPKMPNALQRMRRKLSGKRPALDGKRLPVELDR